MTYNVFGGTLNLAQSINQQYRAACDGSYQSYRVFFTLNQSANYKQTHKE